MTRPALPPLRGTALSGRTVHLPEDLGGGPVTLLFGFAHEAREDVNAWKRALEEAGLPWLSLPTTAAELHDEAVAAVLDAMRARVPASQHDRVIQVHHGGPRLLETMGWTPDLFAKAVVTDRSGEILAEHAEGPFTDRVFRALKAALQGS